MCPQTRVAEHPLEIIGAQLGVWLGSVGWRILRPDNEHARATIAVGDAPRSVAVNSAGTRAYVSNSNAAPLGPDTVSVINTATNTVVATIVVGDFPDGLALTPDGDFLYVTSTSDDTIWVINTATNTVTDTFAVGDRPTELAVGYV